MDPLTRRLFLAPNLIGLSQAEGLFASPKPQNSQRKFGASTSFRRSQSRLSSLLLAIEAPLMYTSVFRDVNHLACSPSSIAPGVTCRTLTHEIAYTRQGPEAAITSCQSIEVPRTRCACTGHWYTGHWTYTRKAQAEGRCA